MTIRKIMQFFFVLIATGLLAACGGGGGSLESGGSSNGSGSGTGTGTGTGTTKAKVAVVLSVEYAAGQSTISKDNPATAVATVTKDGAALANVLVKFALSQAGIGSFKTQTTAQTNASGRASVPLYAGSAGVGAGSFNVTLEGLSTTTYEVTLADAKAFNTQGDETTTSTSPYAISLKLVSKADTSKTITEVSQAVVGQVEITVTKNSQAAVGELVTLTAPALGRLSVTTVQTLAGGKAVVDLYAGDKAGADQLVVAVGSGTDAATAKQVFTTKGDESVASKPIGSIALIVKTLDGRDSNELGSSGVEQLELQAVVVDSNNVAIQGESVAFTSEAGAVLSLVSAGKTNSSGIATARIASATKQNKAIQVTAKIQDKSDTKTINIVGTKLSIENTNATISQGTDNKFKFAISLKDSSGKAVINENVTVTSKLVNFATTTVKTDNSGLVSVDYVPTNAGADEITASAFSDTLKATPSKIMVNTDDFKLAVLGYANVTGGLVQVPTNTPVTFELSWPSAAAGTEIKFNTSAIGFEVGGSKVTDTTVTLDANKKAQVVLNSSIPTAEAVIRASSSVANVSAERRVQLVAVKPSKVVFDAKEPVIAAGSSLAISATVTDENGARVANAKVAFTLTSDSGTGSLSDVIATTNTNGVAIVTYKAGSSTAQSAVGIQANVKEILLNGVLVAVTNVPPDNMTLTVSNEAKSIQVSYNQDEVLVDGDFYIKYIAVLVTDSAGKPVEGVKVTAYSQPLTMYKTDLLGNKTLQYTYAKGYYNKEKPPGSTTPVWVQHATWCQNEDYNFNQTLEQNTLDCGGVLTTGVSEDNPSINCGIFAAGNGDGQLTPGAIGSIDNGVDTTNAKGVVTLKYRYPKRLADWAVVKIGASVKTPAGDQSTGSTEFTLQALAADMKKDDVSPPNQTSKWGTGSNCRSAQ